MLVLKYSDLSPHVPPVVAVLNIDSAWPLKSHQEIELANLTKLGDIPPKVCVHLFALIQWLE